MSEVSKPTRWAYAVYGPKTFGLGEAGEGAFFQIRCMYGDVKMQENIEAMEFIRDAKRIHHETGLTPRQLVEQRDALAEALEKSVAALSTCTPGDISTGHVIHPYFDEEQCGDAEDAARAALALVKGEPK